MASLRRPMCSGTRLLLAAAALTLAAGCATPAEIRQADESRCASYGFRRGTAAFANCLQQEDLARRYGGWSGWPQPYPWR